MSTEQPKMGRFVRAAKCLPTCRHVPLQEMIDEEIAGGYAVPGHVQEAADRGVGFVDHDPDCPALAETLAYARLRFTAEEAS